MKKYPICEINAIKIRYTITKLKKNEIIINDLLIFSIDMHILFKNLIINI